MRQFYCSSFAHVSIPGDVFTKLVQQLFVGKTFSIHFSNYNKTLAEKWHFKDKNIKLHRNIATKV